MSETTDRPTCRAHGYDRYHHAVRPDLKYGAFAWLQLFCGISGKPKQIAFTCSKCGETLEVTRDPAVLSEFRHFPDVYRKPGT